MKTLYFILLVAILELAQAGHASPKCVELILHIDGYSSGRFLPNAVKKFGEQNDREFKNIHVHSGGKPSKSMESTWEPDKFDADYNYDGNMTKLIKWIKSFDAKVSAVWPGSEGGVLLSDKVLEKIHEQYGLPFNGFNEARRNKYLMSEQVRQAGLDAVLQIKSKNVQEALKWIKHNKLWPGKVVVKPLMSASTEDVYFVETEAQLKAAMNKILGKKNKYGINNDYALVQEYLDGDEYVVNTTSRDGHHIVTDIWKYEKINVDGAGAIYKLDALLPYDGELQKKLVEYNLKVLDVLGIKTGWGHAEIKMTSRGPVLIEVGNRMMGSGQPRLISEALGQSQIETGIQAYLNPEKFKTYPQGYKVKNYVAVVNINSDQEGRVMSYKAVPLLLTLESYKRHSFFYDAGSAVPKTVDLTTSLGQVELIHPDPKVIQKDAEQIRQWEKQGLFLK